MHLFKRCTFILIVLACGFQAISFLVPAHVLAFFPTIWRTVNGALGTSHVVITNNAIAAFDQNFFGLPTDSSGQPILTTSMKQARDEIADADAAVDRDQHTAAKHFDGESFTLGQARLTTLRNDTVADLNRYDADAARTALGEALHTLQDFYSHSNWVELGNVAINSALGNGGSVGAIAGDSANTANTVPTCQDCFESAVCGNGVECSTNLITNLITTGYYSGEDVPKPSLTAGQKCSHGGPSDFSTFGITGGINKDSNTCGWSPHFTMHQQAVNLAVAATQQFLQYIQQDLGPNGQDKMKLLLGGGPTLVFVMDTTGSMGDIQGQVTEQAVQIVQNLIAQGSAPAKYVLIPFNDPTVGPALVTTNADTFIDAVGNLPAEGGGDCPELSMTGILEGIAAAGKGAKLFVFTDASPKDSVLAPNVTSSAISNNVQIYPFTFVDSCSSPSDLTYNAAAYLSNGQFFFLQRGEAGAIASLANLIVNSNSTNIVSVFSHLSSKTYPVAVDGTMTQITFVVSGPTGSVTSAGVAITRPDGTVLKNTDTGVSMVTLSTGVIWSVANPTPGIWSVTLNGSGDFSLSVSAKSPLTLTSFRFLQPGGRPGHEGYFPITGNPIAGQNVTIGSIIEGTSNAQFQLRGLDGTVLQNVPLQGASGDTFPPGDLPPGAFFGTTTLPSTPFVAYAIGTDANGNTFQRSVSGTSQPQTIQITAPPAQNLVPSQSTSYTFQIQNLGTDPDNFTVMASDNQGFVTGFTPPGAAIFEPGSPNTAILGYSTSLSLVAGQIGSFTVALKPGRSVLSGTTDKLVLTATGANSGSTNYAVLTSTVSTVGEPSLVGNVLDKGSESAGSLYVDFKLTNSGKGTAASTVITKVTARGLANSGTVQFTNPILPVLVGDIAIDGAAVTRLYFNVPSMLTGFSITVNGTTYDQFGQSLQFSAAASIKP